MTNITYDALAMELTTDYDQVSKNDELCIQKHGFAH